MNSYSLGLSGSVWWLILFISIGILLTLYTYQRTIPPVSARKKTLLIMLRALGIALLLFALFEPVLTIVSGSEISPKLAILIDNSMSAGTNDAHGSRKKLFDEAIEKSGIKSLSDDETVVVYFDNKLRIEDEFNADSINYDGQFTNISKPIDYIREIAAKENIRAALLITDGAFNSGTNPVYDADLFGRPIFTIGIGDSTEPKDVSVQNIITNDIAYLDNPVPVNVNIKINGYYDNDLKIELLDNGNVAGEQKLSIHPDKEEYSLVFEYDPSSEGMHKLTIRAGRLDGEITYKNNYRSEFINVLRNKRVIAIFAGAPSADISFIKNVLNEEKGVEIKEFIQKKGASFYNMPEAGDFKKAELFVLIGFPNKFTPSSVIENVKRELAAGKPILFVASNQTDYRKLKPIEPYLPFNTITSTRQEFMASPDIRPAYMSSPLLRISGSDDDIDKWNTLPPVFKTETFVKAKPESRIIAASKVNNVSLNEPMILSRDFQNKKSVAILAYGLYRWKLLGYAADISRGQTGTTDLFSILFKNCFRWLSVANKNKLVRIKTNKKFYSLNEKIRFVGQVYDASYTPIDNAAVSVQVRVDGQQRKLFLTAAGNGRYTGSMTGLPEGDFAFTGNAVLNSRHLGTDKGRFAIGETSIEFRDLTMNSGLLRNISGRTGGKFYLPETSGDFLSGLKASGAFKSRHVTSRSEFALWNISWLLGVALFCFALEWYIRKRAGMI